MELALILIFGGLAVTSSLLVKAYSSVSIHEMKTRAREGKKTYELIHRAGSYGGMLSVLLWILAGIFTALFLLNIVDEVSATSFILISAIFLAVVFVLLPSLKAFSATLKLASLLAPLFSLALEHLFFVFAPVLRLARKYLPLQSHTGIYDINDFLDLIDSQHLQQDSRIDRHTLDIAHNALTFNYRTVSEITLPMSRVKLISANDTIGPILLNELHQAGMAHFPVYEGDKSNIVGILSAADVVQAKTGGAVRDLMHPYVNHLHEDQLLSEVLEDMLVPGRHMFIVVNEFDELVGTATSEDMIRQIVGYAPKENHFAEYEDNIQNLGEESEEQALPEDSIPEESAEPS